MQTKIVTQPLRVNIERHNEVASFPSHRAFKCFFMGTGFRGKVQIQLVLGGKVQIQRVLGGKVQIVLGAKVQKSETCFTLFRSPPLPKQNNSFLFLEIFQKGKLFSKTMMVIFD